MFMHAETGYRLATLPVNRARWRMPCFGHFKQIIVRLGADQNARMTVGIGVVFGLRKNQIETDGIQRHAVK